MSAHGRRVSQWWRSQERPGVGHLLRRDRRTVQTCPDVTIAPAPDRVRPDLNTGMVQREQMRLASCVRGPMDPCAVSGTPASFRADHRNETGPFDVYARAIGWLSAAMEPIERVFIAMAVIGLVGFVATLLYVTSHWG